MISVLGMNTFGNVIFHSFVQHNPVAGRCGNICRPRASDFEFFSPLSAST